MTDFKDIKAFVFDVDGVLTDGGIYAVSDDLLRRYDSKDCMALRLASMRGFKLGIVTGGISTTIVTRFLRCGFNSDDIYLGSRKKIEQLEDFCARHSLKLSEVMYFGDDLPDIPPITLAGAGVCPCDAAAEVQEVADYVSPFGGGKGFVRDTIERVLKAQGKWELDYDLYKARF